MRIIPVKDVYPMDNISKNNDNAWKLLMGAIKDEDGDVLFDFKDVEISEPWNNNTFKKFISDERVHIKLYSSKKTADTIDVACRLGGLKTGRFFNEDVVTPPKPSREEIIALQMVDELQEYFTYINGVAIFQINDRFDQIGSLNTVDYIEKAVEKYSEEKGEKRVILDATGISIQTIAIKPLTEVIGRLLSKGITFEITTDDEDAMSKIKLYQHTEISKNLTLRDKVRIIKESIPMNMVGMLARYRRSRAVDEFGRYGKGEVVYSRVAIYRGLGKKDGKVCARFTTFNGETFYTKAHWALENDGEMLEELDSEDVIVSLEDLGALNNFLGRRYHFMAPIQYGHEDYTMMYDLTEDGELTYINATVPKRIQMVLDDWGIRYDQSYLLYHILETEKMLDKVQS